MVLNCSANTLYMSPQFAAAQAESGKYWNNQILVNNPLSLTPKVTLYMDNGHYRKRLISSILGNLHILEAPARLIFIWPHYSYIAQTPTNDIVILIGNSWSY